MNINATFSISPEYSSPTPGSRIANLEKQIRAIEKQINAETKSTDDSQAKLQVMQQLQVERQTTQLQIQQIQESMQQSQEKQSSLPPVVADEVPAQPPTDEVKAGALLDALA